MSTPLSISRRTTLTKLLIEQQREHQNLPADLRLLIEVVARACKQISYQVSKGALGEALGTAGSENVQGEVQKKLDILSNEILLEANEWGGNLAAMASEEMEKIFPIPNRYPKGNYLLTFDPLDGSSNIDINGVVGSIFSVLRIPSDAKPDAGIDTAFLRPGHEQVAAGYAIYGPSTMLVISVGNGTHGFTLDREVGNFVLTHSDIRIPEDTCEFAINASNERFWEPPVRRYVQECKDGRSGCRERDFNMRWIASMVAEVHRILMRGGVFMYPRDFKTPAMQGRLRLLYEASPMSFLVEQAGGMSITGRDRILDVQPRALHERVPVILGSKNEVERIARYHADYDRGEDKPFSSPLFSTRSLFLPEAPV